MAVAANLVNELRKMTDAGIMECKKALEQANGDMDKATAILRARGQQKADSKSSRETKEGLVYSYIHAGGKIGVLLELSCETDFVARNDMFQALAKDVAMQVAAMKPAYVDRAEIPKDILDKESAVFRDEAAKSGKPEAVIAKIVDGKLEKWFGERCLLDQTSIKEDKLKVRDLVSEAISKLGENISVRRYTRYQVGESAGN